MNAKRKQNEPEALGNGWFLESRPVASWFEYQVYRPRDDGFDEEASPRFHRKRDALAWHAERTK